LPLHVGEIPTRVILPNDDYMPLRQHTQTHWRKPILDGNPEDKLYLTSTAHGAATGGEWLSE
jgi:hypothetical protein